LKILFAGCGDIGTRSATRLASDFDCFGLKRKPQTLPGFISPIAGSMTDLDLMVEVLNQDFDVLVATLTPDGFNPEAYQRAYVDSAKILASAMAFASSVPKLVIWVSSTSVYGHCNGDWVDELSPTTAQSFSGKLLLEAEQQITALPCATVIVRFSGIYGPGRTRMLDQIIAGKGRPAQPQQWSNRIYSEDCAGVLAHLVRAFDTGKELESLYIATDCAPVTQHDLRIWLAEQLEVELKDEIVEQKAIRRCSNQRLLNSGYEFLYPSYKEGYQSLIEARSK
jgi:nucleoside-diphosphate-sugar epimerase|tara:strand:- start:2981 stop:3823 length:843 start_codon:yes stop_codon:yes gene_type:complete